jgi:hypothetical protein
MKPTENVSVRRSVMTWGLCVIVLAIIGALAFSPWLLFDSGPARLPSATRNVLDHADQFVLYSLDPRSVEYLRPPEAYPQEVFHDFPVLGRVEVQDAAKQAELLRALYEGIAAKNIEPANCFFPRHGVRASLNGVTVDLVICFECSQIQIHPAKGKDVLTSASPQPVFNRVLKEAGVELAEKSH